MSQAEITNEDLADVEASLGSGGEKEFNALERLLGRVLEEHGSYVALATKMGEVGDREGVSPVPSFAIAHSLEWIGQNLLLGSEMPFMHGHIDPETGALKVDESIADEVKQRAPDWTRQPALAAYLARPERKFGPIIAVVSPDWVDDPNHENWDNEGRALRDSTEFTPLDPGGRVGQLRLNGAKTFALDGQHRVLGIRGIREVRDKGFLQLRSRDGSPRDAVISSEEFQSDFKTDVSRMQAVLNDSMVVEYIPAVVKGESRVEANRRVRAVFIAINSYAKRTDKGENILLDENDGFSITARRVAVSHPGLTLEDQTSIVDFKRTNLPAVGNHYLTTLQSIRAVAESLLKASNHDLVRTWTPGIRGAVAVRPGEASLEAAALALSSYLDHFFKLPVFTEFRGLKVIDYKAKLGVWRDFYKLNQRGEYIESSLVNRGHLLLRPLGQEILAKAVSVLISPKDSGGRGLDLSSVFSKISAMDEELMFEAHRPGSPWYGITYSIDGGRMRTGSRSWAHLLLVHLIDGTPAGSLYELASKVIKARTINRETGEWMTLSGRESKNWDLDSVLPDATPIDAQKPRGGVLAVNGAQLPDIYSDPENDYNMAWDKVGGVIDVWVAGATRDQAMEFSIEEFEGTELLERLRKIE